MNRENLKDTFQEFSIPQEIGDPSKGSILGITAKKGLSSYQKGIVQREFLRATELEHSLGLHTQLGECCHFGDREIVACAFTPYQQPATSSDLHRLKHLISALNSLNR